ncbi:MAG: dihydrofolate reductase family protein [Aggregatilineales bacterium]
MGKIIVSQFLSLDGVMEAPETWHFPYISDDMAAFTANDINASTATLYGRKTYEIFSGYWQTQKNNEFGFADHLNKMPKYVVSNTLQNTDWNNTTILRDLDAVKAMKDTVDGNIGITGSRKLIQSLMKANLVDRFQLLVHPIVLGKGRRLFTEEINTISLSLLDSKTFQSGVIALTYALADTLTQAEDQ